MGRPRGCGRQRPDGTSRNSSSSTPGKLTPEQYDGFVRDTVNFLEYMAEPAQLKRRALGFPVIAFLIFFTLLAWALKKEFWKDVK